jgi:magnesium transporter
MKSVTFHKLTWVDFEDPSADDILYLQENFDMHPLAIEEFATPSIRPKATPYHNCLYMAIHIPLYDVKKRTTYPGELDIVITKDHLITGHTENIYQLSQFFQSLEDNEGKRRIYMDQTPAHLLYHLLELLLESCFPKLDHIIENLNKVEEEIFRGNEKEMVKELSIVKRDILNFRRTLKPQRSVLESVLQKEDARYIQNDLKPYYQDLIGTNIRLWNNLESAKETVESLEETNNSLLSHKLNLTMKVLTIFSAVMLPMTVYSNILSMSAPIPLGHSVAGFWVHTAIMLFISGFTILIFRLKKWL